jgi:predicted site-specific integrase-resolvase
MDQTRDNTINPNRVYNVKEAANLLSINPQTLIEYCRRGTVVAKKIGEWKILGQSLINFLVEK